MRTRTHQIKVNLTADELAKFDLARGQVRRSIAARQSILGLKPPRPADPAIASLSLELNRIGNNLNQIARLMNSGKTGSNLTAVAVAEIAELRNRIATA